MAEHRPKPMLRRLPRCLAVLALAMLALPVTGTRAPAAEGKAVTVELNKLEPNGQACRAYVVLSNGAGVAYDSLKLDLVLFDVDGVVAKRLAVETAPLAAGKTSLKVFDIDALPCAGIGRVLLNDVLACAAGGGARADCLADLAPTTRGPVPFIK